MAQTVCVILSSSDRRMLEAITADRNRPQKHVQRAQVVLAAANRDPVQRVAARRGVSRPMVWRWQQRFAEQGALASPVIVGALAHLIQRTGAQAAC